MHSKAGNTKARSPFDPTRVWYSPRWMGAGTLLAGAAALGVQNGGLATAALVGAAGAAGAAYATLVEPRQPRLERVTVRHAAVPASLNGLRIGQLSDLHLGHPYTRENVRWAVTQMLQEQPDLLVLTGDFVSFAHAISDLPHLLWPLEAPLGIYAVAGNHDYWEGVFEIRAMLEALGITFLMNSNRRLEWNGATFWVAGVDDIWDGQPSLDATLADIPTGEFTMLLAHAPDIADEAATRGIALQLSGHTHGGHIRLPGLGAFSLPYHGTRYPIGAMAVGNMQVYVTRGLGGMPLRLGCPPEATIITLERHK